jgi:hypothetical protein
MLARRLTPILNVSNIQDSFVWFEKLGWTKAWDWGDPPHFGGVCSGDCEIFLCENAQGGRGKGAVQATFGPGGDDAADKGAWMSIWVDDVAALPRTGAGGDVAADRHAVERSRDARPAP